MYTIPIILGSIREGRQSPRVAKFIEQKLRATGRVDPQILDLKEFDLPMMEERLHLLADPPEQVVRFGRAIAAADAVVVVSPEYNGSYPGVLKNAIEYLAKEYKRKPFGIVTTSSGNFGGISAQGALRLLALAVGAYPLAVGFPVSRVGESIAEDGTAIDPAYDKRVEGWLGELLWTTEAFADKRAKDAAGAVR
jgi:NAD(P)H-dependent FMN reductase